MTLTIKRTQVALLAVLFAATAGIAVLAASAPVSANHQQSPAVDFCDPSQRDGSVKQWHQNNQFDGDCVTFDYEAVCGALNASITSNSTGLFYEVVGLVGAKPFPSAWPVAGSTNSFPVNFDEDEFGGSVDVYLWLEGGEADFLTDRDLPTFAEQTALKVTVDTDCEDEPKVLGEEVVLPVSLPSTGGPAALIAAAVTGVAGLLSVLSIAFRKSFVKLS